MNPLAPFALIAAAAGLVGLLFVEAAPDSALNPASLGLRPPALTRPGRPAQGAPAQGASPESGKAAAWTETILARPLFSASRRPPPAVAGPKTAAPDQSVPRLAGVLVSPAGSDAIFAGAAGNKPILAHVGDRLGLFTVRAIAAGEVRLDGPDGSVVLHPAFASGGASLVTPAGPAEPERPASILERLRRGIPPPPGVPPAPSLQSLIDRRANVK